MKRLAGSARINRTGIYLVLTMKKRKVTVYLDERQLQFLATDKAISKRTVSAIIRYALNKLDAEHKFNNREYAEIYSE